MRNGGYVLFIQVTRNAYILVETRKLLHAGDVGNDRSKVRRRISPCARHVDIEEEQRYSSSYSQLLERDERPMVKIAFQPYYTAQTAAPAHGIKDRVGEDVLTVHCHCTLDYNIEFLYSYNTSKTNEMH